MFGTGAVGLAAVMASVVAGATIIVGIDLVPARLELARELGATDVVDARHEDPVEAIHALTAGGADFALETTGVPAVLRHAVDCTAPVGVCGIIGAPPFGAEVTLDVNTIMTAGRVVRGIVEGRQRAGRLPASPPRRAPHHDPAPRGARASVDELSVANARPGRSRRSRPTRSRGSANVVVVDSSIGLDVAAPFGCGIRTGAGAVLNSLRVEEAAAAAGAGAVVKPVLLTR